MRVMLASDFYPPFSGGAERQMQVLGQHLTQAGHAVGVATVRQPGQELAGGDSRLPVYRLAGAMLQVPWFFADPAHHRFHPPVPDPLITRGLRRLIAQHRPDVVHAYGWIAHSCAAALAGSHIPLILSAHDYGYTCPARTMLYNNCVCPGPESRRCFACACHTYGLLKGCLVATGVLWGRNALSRRAAAVHCVSSYVAAVIRRDLPRLPQGRAGRIVVIHNVIEEDGPPAAERGLASRLPAEPFILFVGALRPHKGLPQLLEAYRTLQHPPRLVLIGPSWPDSPRAYPAGVINLGDLDHASVMAAWQACLFGVAPSTWPETFGLVIAEAMSMGKAVIASRLGGPADIVLDGVTGLLIPPGDVGALSTAMARMIADAALRERLGQAGQRRIREAFRPEAVMPQFEALYRDCVRGPAGGSRQ